MKIVLINRKQQLRWIVEHALCSLDYIIVDEAASGQSALSAQIRHRSHSIRDDAMQRQQQQQKPKIENWSHDGSLPGTTRKIVAFIRLPVPPHRPLSVCVTSSNTLSLTEKWLETFYDSASPFQSSSAMGITSIEHSWQNPTNTVYLYDTFVPHSGWYTVGTVIFNGLHLVQWRWLNWVLFRLGPSTLYRMQQPNQCTKLCIILLVSK